MFFYECQNVCAPWTNKINQQIKVISVKKVAKKLYGTIILHWLAHNAFFESEIRHTIPENDRPRNDSISEAIYTSSVLFLRVPSPFTTFVGYSSATSRSLVNRDTALERVRRFCFPCANRSSGLATAQQRSTCTCTRRLLRGSTHAYTRIRRERR